MYSFEKCLLVYCAVIFTILQYYSFRKAKKYGFIACLPLENHKNLFVEHQKSFLKTVIL